MAEEGRGRLVLSQLAPLDDLEAALLAVVRGELPGTGLYDVAEALAGASGMDGAAALPEALRSRRLRLLAAEEVVERRAALALWSLTQAIAELRDLRVSRRVGGEVVWADAVLRVAGDGGRPVIVGAASVGWAMEGDHLAAWLGMPLDDLPELLLVAADQPDETPGTLWRYDGPGLDEPGDPLGQALVELFADLKRRLLEAVTVRALRDRLA
ncbi:MAG TPA: hypothetical protein VNK73_00375 [Actinomycetota bacterium]|nr:hypothetical protein [Actinomycetota bacterium]